VTIFTIGKHFLKTRKYGNHFQSLLGKIIPLRANNGVLLMAKQSKTSSTETPKTEETPKPKFRVRKVADGIVTLKMLCAEIKHDPKLARAKLRQAAKDAKQFPALGKAHVAKKSWEWERDSAAFTEARKVLG